MEAAEGKLFRPLAYTKTFALISAVIVALVFIPPLAHSLFSIKIDRKKLSLGVSAIAFVASHDCLLSFWRQPSNSDY